MIYESSVINKLHNLKLNCDVRFARRCGLFSVGITDWSPLSILPVSHKFYDECRELSFKRLQIELRLDRHSSGMGPLPEFGLEYLLFLPLNFFNRIQRMAIDLVPRSPEEWPLAESYLYSSDAWRTCYDPRILKGWIGQLRGINHVRLTLHLQAGADPDENAYPFQADYRYLSNGILEPRRFMDMDTRALQTVIRTSLQTLEKAIIVHSAQWTAIWDHEANEMDNALSFLPFSELSRVSKGTLTFGADPFSGPYTWHGLDLELIEAGDSYHEYNLRFRGLD